MSVGQQALTLLRELNPLRRGLRITTPLVVDSLCDPTRVASALRTIWEKNDILRCRIERTAHGPQLRLADFPPDELLCVDGSEWDEAERDAWIDREVDLAAAAPEDGTSLRLLCRRTADGATERLLLITLPHVIADFRSVEILTRDLEAVYAGGLPERGSVVSLPFDRYVEHERAWLATPEATRELNESAERLRESIGIRLHGASRSPPCSRLEGVEQRRVLPPQLSERIRSTARALSVTPYVLMMAGYALLIGVAGDRRRFVLGSTADLRQESRWRHTVGYLVNTVPIAIDLHTEEKANALIRSLREAVVASHRRARLPLACVVQALARVRGAREGRFCQVAFTWLKYERDFGRLRPGNLIVDTLRWSGPRPVTTSHDLTLTVEDRVEGFECLWTLDTELFEADSADALARCYELILHEICMSPDIRTGDLFDIAMPELHHGRRESHVF